MKPTGLECRRAQAADLSFLDHLQHLFAKQLGYLPLKALEVHAEKGNVLLAIENGQPAGYLLGAKRYHGLDSVSIIYQAAVPYDAQRRAIGALLLQRFCYELPSTVQQVCLWCAQDIEANLFWEAMGFTPHAYRLGSARRQRIHVYWCLRDDGRPPYIPDQTHSGLVRQARPIYRLQPGQPWADKLKVEPLALVTDSGTSPDASAKVKRSPRPRSSADRRKARSELAQAAEAFRSGTRGHIVLVGGRVVTLPSRPIQPG